MLDAKEPQMSKQEFSVAYDGEARRDDHTIDVEILSPALMAIGKLIREANTEFNGTKSTAKVLVVSDFEHKCFNINFELVLSLYEQVKTLLGDDSVKTAKDILEWIGLITMVAGAPMSLLGFLKWRKGREIVEKRETIDRDAAGIVTVQVKGEDNRVQITNHVFHLSQNPAALKSVRDAFSPVGKDGIDKVKVRLHGEVHSTLVREEIEAIVQSAIVGIEEAEPAEGEQDTTPKEAWLSVYSPVFDENAQNWRFKLGTDVIVADVSATTIAADAMDRGGASPNDAYNVMLEITETLAGRPRYKVLEVRRFIPAVEQPSRQQSLDLTPQRDALLSKPRTRMPPRPKKS